MLNLYKKFLCCGSSKTRSRSAYPTEGEMQTLKQNFECDICLQNFASKNLLTSHRLNHTESQGQSENAQFKKRNRIQNLPNLKVSQVTEDTPRKEDRLERSNVDSTRNLYPSKNLSEMSDKSDRASLRGRGSLTSGLSPELEQEVDKIVNELLKKPAKIRREQELNFITKNIDKRTPVRFLVSESWIENYTAFLNGNSKKAPEPIDNEPLKHKVITKTLPPNIYLINEIVWTFVYKLYGGGPEIKRCKKGIIFGGDQYSDQLSETQTTDAFSRTDSLRASFADTFKSGWSPTSPHLKPVGLTNPCFFCYMNSCLQMLLGITELAQYISHEKYKTFLIKPESFFWIAMTEIVHGHFRQQNCVTPDGLRAISRRYFDPSQQHDAHEFLRFVISGMQEEINLPIPKKEMAFNNPDSAWIHYRKFNTSLIDDLLAGQLLSTVTCTYCRHVSTTYDPFLDLSLPIIPEKTTDLNDCLAAFQKEEEIDDSYKCEKCKKNAKVIKRLSIYRYPKYLVINLKRFQTFPKKKKLKDNISFPALNWKVTVQSTKEETYYSLLGVIVHFGPIDSGHYVCYTKRGSDWVLCDDENIKKVDEREVISQEAYVLIYENSQLNKSKL